MALTLSQKVRMSIGGKAFRAYEVTHDESTGSIAASEFELAHFDVAMATTGTQGSAKGYTDLTVTNGASITFTPLSVATKTIVWAFGF